MGEERQRQLKELVKLGDMLAVENDLAPSVRRQAKKEYRELSGKLFPKKEGMNELLKGEPLFTYDNR